VLAKEGFFFIVPPSGESQLNPNSIDDNAEDDFSLRLPELADRLESVDVGVWLLLEPSWDDIRLLPLLA